MDWQEEHIYDGLEEKVIQLQEELEHKSKVLDTVWQRLQHIETELDKESEVNYE